MWIVVIGLCCACSHLWNKNSHNTSSSKKTSSIHRNGGKKSNKHKNSMTRNTTSSNIVFFIIRSNLTLTGIGRGVGGGVEFNPPI